MNKQEFLQADRRWTVWGCQSHEQYLEKYFLPGKFHSAVPEKVKEAYHTVERLIAYSYFYYPMTEEAGSKVSRIFEMAVRIRAQELGIATDKITKAGKIQPENLSVLIDNLRKYPESDQEWGEEWVDFKSLRNLYAHPGGPNYGGAVNLMAIVPMINIINSIFITTDWFKATRERVKALQDRAEFYSKGLYVLGLNGNRLLLTRAVPVMVSLDEKRSLWFLEPVGLKFPQNMDEYFAFNPIMIKLSDVVIKDASLYGYDYMKSIAITISPTDHPDDIACTKIYFEQQNTAREQVRIVHNQNTNYHLYYEREKFIYDEFWEVPV
jgi:hypothetical protein